ncbi:guanylyl cyclase-activating protein 3 [Monodelphis domestica]|uniref:guanylyl cyclase-activating protein 3 n=1 Tax=Monodelphis domestica TaxID=13616 RepID=UPI000443118F|nr:guanylyl cyclase-activating protein 3 [Monodelphis domestica]
MKITPKRKLLIQGIPMGGKESVAGGPTAITAVETHVWFKRFMTECPSGLQTLHEFKALLGLQGLNQRANQYVDQLFNIFDKNKDGFIDFLEFIAAVNLVIRGKMDQKLKWYFKLYDADGNGSIDRKELLNIFTAIQAINGQNTLNPQEFANLIFEKTDTNNDGELTLEEFISGLEKDPHLLEMISKSFDLSNVLKIIQHEREQDT